MESLRVCLATSEIHPFSKAGGLADVSGALARYLSAAGHEIRVFSPLYATVDTEQHPVVPVDFLSDIPCDIGGNTFHFSIFSGVLPGTELWVYFVHCPELYDRPNIYTNDLDEHRRFILLNHAVFLSCQRMGWSPQILHCNDWPTALIPILLRSTYSWDGLFRESRTVFTIHNIEYQGVFSSRIRNEVVPWSFTHLLHQGDLAADRVNFLKTAILFADTLTTVSPTYAREIQSREFGAGLDGLLASRHQDLVGILNGVDYQEWSPASDPCIPFPYDGRNPIKGKLENKKVLLQKMGLPYRGRVPLIGSVSRLVSQKGFELLFDSFPALLETRDFQFVLLGTGERRYTDFFVWLAQRFPDQVSFYSGYSNELAHLVEAGADLFLMPSRYEPCGLSQMYSLKYGTVPIVRRTGGLADTVQLFDPGTAQGTGFVFDHYNSEGLGWAVSFALDVFEDRTAWLKLIRNGMAQDYSWQTQVREYTQLYESLVQT